MTFFDWENYLDLAAYLSKDDAEEEAHLEAALRSAISRAYYAVFHLAKKLLEDNGIRVPREEGQNSHENVWATFERGPNETWTEIASSGKRLKDKRTIVDYKLRRKPIHKWREEATTSVSDADEILDWIKKIKVQINEEGLNRSLFD